MLPEYICESDLTPSEQDEGFEDGLILANDGSGDALVFWRVDADGRRWYRRSLGEIHGVPRDDFASGQIDDDDDDVEFDDD